MNVMKAITLLLIAFPIFAHSTTVKFETLGKAMYKNEIARELKKSHYKKLNHHFLCSGNKVEVNCGEKKRVRVLLIDTKDKSIDYSNYGVLSKIKKADWAVLMGDQLSNRDAAFDLLGYSVASSIIAIKSPGNKSDIELFTYSHNGRAKADKIAETMLKSFVK